MVKLRIHSGSAFDPQDKEGTMALLGRILFPERSGERFFPRRFRRKSRCRKQLRLYSNHGDRQIPINIWRCSKLSPMPFPIRRLIKKPPLKSFPHGSKKSKNWKKILHTSPTVPSPKDYTAIIPTAERRWERANLCEKLISPI